MPTIVKRVIKLLALPGILLLLVMGAEAWVRSRIFGTDPAYASWREPDLYTWRYRLNGRVIRSDDHAKLAARWGLLMPKAEHAHALLGWHGALDSLTLLPPGFVRDSARTPLVLLGWGWQRHSVAELLMRDSALLRTHQPVLLAVEGFSLDQDLLLLERTRPLLSGARVMLWVELDALDRLQRSFLDRPKPRFTSDVYVGVLEDAPVPTDPTAYVTTHPPDPGLYAYHLFRSRVLNDTLMSRSAMESRERQLAELTGKLLMPTLQAATKHGQQVVVLIEQGEAGEHTDRRRWAVGEACRKVKAAHHPLERRSGADPGRQGALFVQRSLGGGVLLEGMDSLRAELDRPAEFLTPLQRHMASILHDPSWLEKVRAKASEQGVPLATMVERDAHYMLDMANSEHP
ncbi:MAG: hypothetical protein JNL05_04595 [Flavobacteriales bacterium]|nr:hypothetical protein [Flavobacteriales bacterium]